jgi:hypothetical protein
MLTQPQPEIDGVERLSGGVFVSLTNGRSALYSAPLLYAIIGQATEFRPGGPEGLQDTEPV